MYVHVRITRLMQVKTLETVFQRSIKDNAEPTAQRWCTAGISSFRCLAAHHATSRFRYSFYGNSFADKRKRRSILHRQLHRLSVQLRKNERFERLLRPMLMIRRLRTVTHSSVFRARESRATNYNKRVSFS